MTTVEYHSGYFPPKSLDWEQLVPLLGRANAALARYDGVLHAVPNPNVLLSPLKSHEATLSSKIEGTQVSMSEVLTFEAQGFVINAQEVNSKTLDIQEVINYRTALHEASLMLDTLPLSQRLMKETHRILLQGVRGVNKAPGEYRRISNWIGPQGCSMEEARFVPCQADKLIEAMSSWEKYLHTEAPDALVQLAIIHAEFEAIHPFLDGNGRLGRLLIPLFLKDKKLLSQPNFYISAYLERHREEYYDRLLRVSSQNDWTGWCLFFLKALTEQAFENQEKAKEIIMLYQDVKLWSEKALRSQYGVRAIDWYFNKPIFKSSDFINHSGIPKATAKRLVSIALKENILRELIPASGSKSSLLVFHTLLNIAEGQNVF